MRNLGWSNAGLAYYNVLYDKVVVDRNLRGEEFTKQMALTMADRNKLKSKIKANKRKVKIVARNDMNRMWKDMEYYDNGANEDDWDEPNDSNVAQRSFAEI